MEDRVLVVTGGLGFIGKHFVRRCLELGNYVTNIDVANYAADRVAMKEFADFPKYHFVQKDIADLGHIPEAEYLVNFAAESHVDNSIVDNRQFCRTNILGTQQLLELTRSRMAWLSPKGWPLCLWAKRPSSSAIANGRLVLYPP